MKVSIDSVVTIYEPDVKVVHARREELSQIYETYMVDFIYRLPYWDIEALMLPKVVEIQNGAITGFLTDIKIIEIIVKSKSHAVLTHIFNNDFIQAVTVHPASTVTFYTKNLIQKYTFNNTTNKIFKNIDVKKLMKIALVSDAVYHKNYSDEFALTNANTFKEFQSCDEELLEEFMKQNSLSFSKHRMVQYIQNNYFILNVIAKDISKCDLLIPNIRSLIVSFLNLEDVVIGGEHPPQIDSGDQV